jgi:glutaredoxin 3
MNIAIYSKEGCPYCDKIKTVLDQRSISYKSYNLDEDYTRDEFYEKFGSGSTFPQVIIDDNKIGGCSDTVNYLLEKNLI